MPEALASIIDRCLERDRDKRWPDARSLRDALAPFADHVPVRRLTTAIAVTGSGSGSAPEAETLLARSTPARTESTWSAVRVGQRAPRRALLAAGGVVALVALGVWWSRPASLPPSAASDLPGLLPSTHVAPPREPPTVTPSTEPSATNSSGAAASPTATASGAAVRRPVVSPRRPAQPRPPRNPDDLMKTRD